MNNFTKLLLYASSITLCQWLSASNNLFIEKESNTLHLSRNEQSLVVYGYARKLYDLPSALCELIQYFLHGNPSQYKGKNLPKDLSGENLSGFDFTGCTFKYTNLMNSNLKGVVLQNTVCQYDRHHLIKRVNISSNIHTYWAVYMGFILEDLEKISYLYGKLPKCSQKARLLHIASALASIYVDMWSYNGDLLENVRREFLVKVYYWCFSLFMFKREIVKEKVLKEQISEFAFEKGFEDYIELACWQLKCCNDLQTSILAKSELPKDISEYASNFEKGVKKKHEDINEYFPSTVLEMLQGLGKVYPKIQNKKTKRKVFEVAYLLCHTYELGKERLLQAYLDCQFNLIKIKKIVEKEENLTGYIIIKPPTIPSY